MENRTFAFCWAVLFLLGSPPAAFGQVSMSIAFHGEWVSARFPSLKSTMDCQGRIEGIDRNKDGMIEYSPADAKANEVSLFQLTCYFNDRDARGGWQAGCGPVTTNFKTGYFKVRASPGAYTQGSADLTISNLTWTYAAAARTCMLKVSDQFGPVLNVVDSGGNDDIPYYRSQRIWTFAAA